jgi:hypothetical protein
MGDGGAPDSGGTAGDGSGGSGGSSSSGGSTSGGGSSTSGGAGDGGGTPSTGGKSASGGSTSSGGSSGKGGSSGSGGSGGSGGCTPTNGSVEICDGLDNDCSNGADDGVTCPTGCTGVAFGGNGYQFCQAEIAWQTARTNCEMQGMHLVKVDSDAENTFIGTTMFGTASAFVWLGGDDLTTSDSWLWHDGSLFWTGPSSGSAPSGVYTNWFPSYPSAGGNTRCLEMRDDYSWNDKQCSQSKRYVCELLYL